MNKENQYAVITPEGYTIKDDAYHIFKRFDDYHAQDLPDQQSTNGGALLDSVIKSFKLILQNTLSERLDVLMSNSNFSCRLIRSDFFAISLMLV